MTYNGQSVTAPIVVVQNNVGIFTVSQTGTGDAIAFLQSDNGLITPTHSANPDDIVFFLGTGLGAVANDETQKAIDADMPSVPLQVFIGGQQATVLFRGRNSCCSGVDFIFVRVPQGVSGCAVSVLMQVGNLVSNSISIPVAAAGSRTCTPTTPGVSVNQGTYSGGGIALERISETIAGIGSFPATVVKMDLLGGSFVKITPAATSQGSQFDIPSYGSCAVTTYNGNNKPVTGPQPTIQYLDAGANIAMSAPFGNRAIARTNLSGLTIYSATLDNTASTLVAGAYTFTGSGGADVGQFTVTYNMPPPLEWTPPTTVNRAAGLTVNWTGGDPAGYVGISGTSTFYGTTAATTAVASFNCTARTSAGTFTVPPIVLLALPPSGNFPNTTSLSQGTLGLSSASGAALFQASGLSLGGGVTSSFTYVTSATYQ